MLLYFIDIMDPDIINIIGDHTNRLMWYYIPYGGAIGALAGGFMAKTVGRRIGMLLTDVFVIIGCLFAMWAVWKKLLWMQALGLAFMAMGAGSNSTIVPLYIKEISPVSISGWTGSYF